MNRYVLTLATVAAGFLAALLPSPERDRLARERSIDVAPFSLAVGVLEVVAGVLLFMAGGIAFVRYGGTATSMFLLENWTPGLTNVHMQGAGLLNWLAWFLHPEAWLYGSIALVGGLRCAAFAITREPVAEPVVWAAVRAFQSFGRRWRTRRRERAFGPRRQDRVEPGPPGECTVLTRDPKPEWNPLVTIEIGGRFYRMIDVEEREEGPFKVLAYRLRERDPSEVIRRLYRYDPSGV